MYPFWDLAIQPVLQAAGARRIVEVGALKGDTTVRMLSGLGADAELHVIDPLPAFDPAEHERQFPGQYIFHRDISLNVLADLPAMDAALIDGDHNWYTVYHELLALRDVSRAAERPLPVLLMHDVGWPYGRRDLYYAPEQIPDEHRQPYERGGVRPGVSELLPFGGMNPDNCNATHEGGPRNGVMTALEDFLAEHDRPYRLVVLPVYFGLAIVAEHEVLDVHPALVEQLDLLESAEGQLALARLAEEQRLETLVEYHGVYFGVADRLAATTRKHLDALRRAAMEGEESSVERGRLDAVEAALDATRTEQVAGDLVTCGPTTAGGAAFLRAYAEAHHMDFRRVFVASPSLAETRATRATFERLGFLDLRSRLLTGPYEQALADPAIERIAFLRIGEAASGEAGAILATVGDRLSTGATVVVDGYDDERCRAAVDDVRTRFGIHDPIDLIGSSAAVWRWFGTDGTGHEAIGIPAAAGSDG